MTEFVIHNCDCVAGFEEHLEPDTIDLTVTSIPSKLSMAERVRRGLLQPNVEFDCAVCGEHVEKYVPPSEVAKGKAANLYCSQRCRGIAQSGDNHPYWQGGRRMERGYVLVWAPEHPEARRGYVREHRLVMGQHLGRPVTREGVVHHENGDKANNRIENLRLFANHSEHKRYEIAAAARDAKGRLLPA